MWTSPSGSAQGAPPTSEISWSVIDGGLIVPWPWVTLAADACPRLSTPSSPADRGRAGVGDGVVQRFGHEGFRIALIALATGSSELVPGCFADDVSRRRSVADIEGLDRLPRDLEPGLRPAAAPGSSSPLPRVVWRQAPDGGLPTGRRQGRLACRSHHHLVGGARPTVPRTRRSSTPARARRGAATPTRREGRLVHGDVHQWNALEAAGGFKLVDPDGLLAEAEYDLGIIMREDPLEGDPHERARWLAARTGSTRSRSGSGAWSSACRPACWDPRRPPAGGRDDAGPAIATQAAARGAERHRGTSPYLRSAHSSDVFLSAGHVSDTQRPDSLGGEPRPGPRGQPACRATLRAYDARRRRLRRPRVCARAAAPPDPDARERAVATPRRRDALSGDARPRAGNLGGVRPRAGAGRRGGRGPGPPAGRAAPLAERGARHRRARDRDPLGALAAPRRAACWRWAPRSPRRRTSPGCSAPGSSWSASISRHRVEGMETVQADVRCFRSPTARSTRCCSSPRSSTWAPTTRLRARRRARRRRRRLRALRELGACSSRTAACC